MARRLIANRQRLRSAILYVPEPGPLLALLFLQYFDRLKPAQLVLTFHGSEIQWLASRWILRWSTTHLLGKATRIGVVSAFALDLLSQHFPAAATKAVITPGALRTDLSSCALERRPHPKPKTIILTVARLNPRKGQLQVIAALQALPADQRASLEYWLVGSHGKDKYDDALATAAREADFSVKFLGDIPDDQLSDIYAQADIFAMTSMPHKQSIEGFGLVYLEAGAHGLPIIAHAIGGVPEAVAHGETGLLVAPDDIAALTVAFAQLIADPALRHRLGEAGRVRAIRHTWTDAVQSLLG
jgi:glycosyltransferase involved in cell wall biosynthesis